MSLFIYKRFVIKSDNILLFSNFYYFKVLKILVLRKSNLSTRPNLFEMRVFCLNYLGNTSCN